MGKVTAVNRNNMYKWILDALDGAELTAREIAVVLHRQGYIPYPIRQATAPRLTELELAQRVAVVGVKIDEESHKTVSVYKKQ